jgi:hypothetical protein
MKIANQILLRKGWFIINIILHLISITHPTWIVSKNICHVSCKFTRFGFDSFPTALQQFESPLGVCSHLFIVLAHNPNPEHLLLPRVCNWVTTNFQPWLHKKHIFLWGEVAQFPATRYDLPSSTSWCWTSFTMTLFYYCWFSSLNRCRKWLILSWGCRRRWCNW